MDIYSASSVSLLELRLTQILLPIMVVEKQNLRDEFPELVSGRNWFSNRSSWKDLMTMWSVVKRTHVV